MRTKWQILNERVDNLIEEVSNLTIELVGLSQTKCGLTCSGCGVVLETEKDFADHFVINDERYLNLGECPAVMIDRKGHL